MTKLEKWLIFSTVLGFGLFLGSITETFAGPININWEAWSALGGLGSAIVAFIAAYYGRQSAKISQSALQSGQISANAALEAVRVAREMGERQVRAYVGISTVYVCNMRPGGAPVYIIGIRNTGNSPAYGVRSVWAVFQVNIPDDPNKVKIRFKGRDPTHKWRMPFDLGGSQDHTFTVYLGSAGQAKGAVIDKTALDFTLSGSIKHMIAGFISYRDAFGSLRRTTFRLQLDPVEIDPNGRGPFYICAKHNNSN